MLPDFLCVGAQKAGTTWLHAMLSQHPDIYLGPLKEYQYFNSVFIPSHRDWTKNHVMNGVKNAIKRHVNSKGKVDPEYMGLLSRMVQHDNILTEEWYKDIFSHKDARFKCRGDITPSYSTLPSAGIKYVKNLLGNPKIIYIVRDPYSRAVSHFNMLLSRRGAPDDMSESKWLEWANHPDIVHRGDYKAYIPRWREYFDDEDLLFVPYKDVSQSPLSFIKIVESHIGVSRHSYEGLESRVHAAKKRKIPDYCLDRIRERVDEQAVFLHKHFGNDFVKRT